MKPSLILSSLLLGLCLVTFTLATLMVASPSAAAPATLDCSQVVTIPQIECQALVVLYHSADGPNWTDNSGWLADSNPCHWYGVLCDAGHVVRLQLSNNQLNGVIPPELANLTSLEQIHFFENRLRGQIPPELGSLSNLQYLSLERNELSGVIPIELANLSNLEWLILDNNELSGTIPAELANLADLHWVNLSSNQLSGSIPVELTTLGNLGLLSLANNQLSGQIPTYLADFPNLVVLNLSGNQFSGSIPPEIGHFAHLQSLNLGSNQLSGSIPAELGDLISLRALILSGNQLSGNIPAELGHLINLRYLVLFDTQLEGALPQTFTWLGLVALFSFYNTLLCTPDNPAMNGWLAGRPIVYGTGRICGEPAAAVGGIVTDEGDEPLAGARVTLYRDVETKIELAAQVTDDDGRYAFGELGQDINYYLHFQYSNGMWANEYYEGKWTLDTADPITLTLGITRTINVQLTSLEVAFLPIVVR